MGALLEKYEKRRKLAQKKLARVETNTGRVSETIEELRRRLLHTPLPDEKAELQKRLDFFISQKADLDAAKTKLEEVIKKLERLMTSPHLAAKEAAFAEEAEVLDAHTVAKVGHDGAWLQMKTGARWEVFEEDRAIAAKWKPRMKVEDRYPEPLLHEGLFELRHAPSATAVRVREPLE